MTSHPPEPPAPRPPSPEEGPADHGQQPGQLDEWRAFQRPQRDRPANGDRAATAYPRGGGPDNPPDAGYEHAPDHPSGGAGHDDHLDYPDYPDYPSYLAVPSHPDPAGYLAVPSYPDPPAYPRAGYPPQACPDGPQPTAIPGAPAAHEEYVHPPGQSHAGPDRLRAADAAPTAGSEGTRWAMLAYLTVPFFGLLVPLAIYLTFLRRSPWVRGHAAQAMNVWLTGILYDLSAAIIAAILVLDSPRVALTVALPLAAALWLVTLAFLVRAAATAARGGAYTVPRWLCAPLVR